MVALIIIVFMIKGALSRTLRPKEERKYEDNGKKKKIDTCGLDEYDVRDDPNLDKETGKRVIYDENGYEIRRPATVFWVILCIAYWTMPFDLIPDKFIVFFGVGIYDDIALTVYAITRFFKATEFDRKLRNYNINIDDVASKAYKTTTTNPDYKVKTKIGGSGVEDNMYSRRNLEKRERKDSGIERYGGEIKEIEYQEDPAE